MRQSSLLVMLVSLVSVVTAYDLVGSWTQRERGGQGALTFQFARSCDSSGSITAKLFVYDCFLAQFLFEAEEDSLSISFQTSTLLTQNCPLTELNRLRSAAQKVTGFELAFDQLRLIALNGEPVFELVRQKYDYTKVLSGVWAMSTPSAAGVNPLRINGSLLSLCGDQAQLSYTLATINGSYPRVSPLLTQAAPNCPDAAFLLSLQSAAFPRIADNLTQVVLLDGRGNYLMTLDQIATLPPSQPLLTANKQSSPLPDARPPYQIRQEAPITPPPTQQRNPIIQQSSPISQQSSSIIQQSSPITQQSNSFTQERISTQQTVYQQKTTINAPQITSNNLQTATNHQIVSNQQSQPASSFSWDFGQNYVFGGTFSSSSPFSFDPSPIQTDTPDSTAILSTQDTLITQDAAISPQDPAFSTQDSGISVEDAGINTQDAGMNVQDAISTQDSSSSLTQDTASSIQESASQDGTMTSNAAVGVGVADLISQSMSGGSVSLGEVVQGSKWLLVWLNGVNSLQQFSRVYLMFTSTRMVLYCPCNTYYANYQLQGNALKAQGWRGTSNRCDSNNDRSVTDYVFYANSLRLKGQNIAFFYNSQAQLAEFKPYY